MMKAITINNPVNVLSCQSLEKEQFKEQSLINRLCKMNIRRLVKNKEEKEKLNVQVIEGRMFYTCK